MSTSYFGSAIRSGTSPSDLGAAASDTGQVVLARSITLQAATAASVDGTMLVPPNSRILDLLIDTTVLWTASGAVALTVGITAGGTEYVTSIDLKSGTRAAVTFTAAQLAAMSNVGANTSVICRAATASGSNAVGTTKVTMTYVYTGA